MFVETLGASHLKTMAMRGQPLSRGAAAPAHPHRAGRLVERGTVPRIPPGPRSPRVAPMWDAIVAGAGPAGAVAAFMLARNGRARAACGQDRPVGAQDRRGTARRCRAPAALARSPGARTAAGRILPSAEICRPGIPTALVATDFIRDPYGPGWRLDRLRFDAGPARGCGAAPARHIAARMSAISRGENAGWRIRFDDGSVERARWIVDATGRRAALARRLGVERQRDAG